jgi:hypothetical protein
MGCRRWCRCRCCCPSPCRWPVWPHPDAASCLCHSRSRTCPSHFVMKRRIRINHWVNRGRKIAMSHQKTGMAKKCPIPIDPGMAIRIKKEMFGCQINQDMVALIGMLKEKMEVTVIFIQVGVCVREGNKHEIHTGN